MKVIGGVIGYESSPDAASTPKVWDVCPSLFFVNARSALRFLLSRLDTETVWLPSFLCPEILNALKGVRAKVQFFPIGKNLRCEDRGVIRQIQKNDFVVMIDYFGISWDTSFALEVKKQGAKVFYDGCQALFSAQKDFSVETGADYLQFSPRKEIGVSDGGVLVACGTGSEEIIHRTTLHSPPLDWLAQADAACDLRGRFDRGETTDRSWFEKYQDAEALAPTGMFMMSEKSRRILDATDFLTLAQRRRENYLTLLEHLREFALVPILGDGRVPLGFPVRAPLRDQVRKKLFSKEIFPPVHWQLHDESLGAFQSALSLSREIMTLPCDHRYSNTDMERLANEFKKAALSVIELRPLEMGDLERIHRWQNNRELYQHLVGEFFGPTLDQARDWLSQQTQPNPLQLSLAICLEETHEHIGNFYYRHIDYREREAELHIFLGNSSYRNQGIGTATTRTALDFAWNRLKLKRVYLYVLSENIRAVKMYEKVGFKKEEELKSHAMKEGRGRDVLRMSINYSRN